MRVELVNIGTELLAGFVLNTHAAYIGRHLHEMGVALTRQVCIKDGSDDICAALDEARSRTDVILTTGGLGPTSDDLTRKAVIQRLGLKTYVDEMALDNIRLHYRRRNASMPASVACQAEVPIGSVVLQNSCGTAPGLAIPLQGSLCRWLIMLPGPPRELKPMFEQQVLPLLRREFAGRLPTLDCRILKVTGMGESAVEQAIEPVLKEIKGLEIGYCARMGEVDIRLVMSGLDDDQVHQISNQAEVHIRKILGRAVFGLGNDTLEAVVVGQLRSLRQSITTAESCTGGFLAHRITMVSGSSEIFSEGWITYSNEAKMKLLKIPVHFLEEYGAVSEPVARAMAEGARQRAKADHALAVTGIAGPSGGTPEKPVGTVFIAHASAGNTTVERHYFPYDRETFKLTTSQAALNLLRQSLG